MSNLTAREAFDNSCKGLWIRRLKEQVEKDDAEIWYGFPTWEEDLSICIAEGVTYPEFRNEVFQKFLQQKFNLCKKV